MTIKTWAGCNLGVRPLWDPEEAGGVKVPQMDPRADAVRAEDLTAAVGQRVNAFPRPSRAMAGYDWRNEARGSGRPKQMGGE